MRLTTKIAFALALFFTSCNHLSAAGKCRDAYDPISCQIINNTLNESGKEFREPFMMLAPMPTIDPVESPPIKFPVRQARQP